MIGTRARRRGGLIFLLAVAGALCAAGWHQAMVSPPGPREDPSEQRAAPQSEPPPETRVADASGDPTPGPVQVAPATDSAPVVEPPLLSRPPTPTREQSRLLRELLEAQADRHEDADPADLRAVTTTTRPQLWKFMWWIPDLSRAQLGGIAELLFDENLSTTQKQPELYRRINRARKRASEVCPERLPSFGQDHMPVFRSLDPELDRMLADIKSRKMDQFRSIRSLLSPAQNGRLDHYGACVVE